MRLLMTFSVCTFLFITRAQAQELAPLEIGKTTFGIKGGINQFLLNENNSSADLGFYLGLFSETQLSNKWSIRNELIYTQNTEVVRNTEDALNPESTLNLTFFEVPVHLKYSLTEKLSLFAGPKLVFLSAGNANTVGLSVDAGLQYDISKKFFLEARYAKDIFTQKRANNGFRNPDSSLDQLRIGIGFKF